MQVLHVDNVRKTYGGSSFALDGVSFSIDKGEFVAIIGPSGAGKSTLLRCINRLIAVTSGTVAVNGTDVTKLSNSGLRVLRRTVGMIFQHYNLVNRLTVIENVLHGRLGYKSSLSGTFGLFSHAEKMRAYELLQAVGLSEQIYQRCGQLSGGQKQRVGIARALIQDPTLMLCDEPIASLDPNAAKIVMDTLRDINTRLGITVVANLHQVHAAREYAHRIIGVNAGKVVFDGPPSLLTLEIIQQIYGSEAQDLMLADGELHA